MESINFCFHGRELLGIPFAPLKLLRKLLYLRTQLLAAEKELLYVSMGFLEVKLEGLEGAKLSLHLGSFLSKVPELLIALEVGSGKGLLEPLGLMLGRGKFLPEGHMGGS